MTASRLIALGLGLSLVAALAWAQPKPGAPSSSNGPVKTGAGAQAEGPAKGDPTADAPAPPPVSLSALVDQTVARFPNLEGEVVEVSGRDLTLSLGRADGVEPGLTFSVVHEGREIKHPRTGEVLGRTEDVAGRATATQVFDAVSIASFEGREARVGDRVRIGAGKIRLTLLALRGGAKDNLVEAVTHELYDGLVSTGRFTVVIGEQIAVWQSQQGIAAADFLQGRGVAEAASRFKADNLLVVAFSSVDKKPVMDVRLFTQPVPEPVFSTVFFVPPSIKARTPGQFSSADRANVTPERKPKNLLQRLLGLETQTGYSAGEPTLPLREVAKFDFPVIVMDMAVSPDGIPRIALSDGDKILLYRIVNRALEPEWTYFADRVGRVVGMSLVDLDGDGRPELAVNRYDLNRHVYSFVLAGKNGKPSVVARDDNWLLGLDETGSGLKRTLWVQEYSGQTMFGVRKVERAAPKDGRIVSLGRVPVPESFRATGVSTSSIMGKDTRALVYIDAYSRFLIALGAEETWRSSASVGGGGYLKVELIRYLQNRGGISKFFSLEPTPLSADLDGDGVDEVVVPQNQIPGLMGVMFRSPVGIRFQQVGSGFEGMITGLGAIRGEDRDPPTLILCVTQFTGLISKRVGESRIVMTAPE